MQVALHGDLDFAEKEALEDLLDSSLQLSPRVVVDLSDVDFVDSTALSTLAAAHDAAEARGGQVRLRGLNGAGRRLLRITRLQHLEGHVALR